MVIAVNAIFFQPNLLEGYGNYANEIISRLVESHPEHEFVLVFDRAYSHPFFTAPNLKSIQVGPPARHVPAFLYWYNISAVLALRKIKPDIWVQPYGFCSLTSKTPQLLVIHDLAFHHFPHQISWLQRWHYKIFTPHFLNKAANIVTVSEFSKKDIEQQYPLTTKPIKVISGAARKGFVPISWEEKEQLKEAYTDGYEFFLCVGGISPRKNMMNLLKAFSLFKKWHKSNMKLVFVGRLAWQYRVFQEKLKTYKYRNDVILTGYLADAVLQKLTASAYASLYISDFEGFGLPIVEAMQSGVPVITANNSSMPEVGGDAVLYADAKNPAAIAEQMQIVYRDEKIRETLIQKGLQRAVHHNWDTAAELFWQEILNTVTVKP
jgi:glycosyltransferase involved in cell wall biosynthesis